jgi:hypothetical protein
LQRPKKGARDLLYPILSFSKGNSWQRYSTTTDTELGPVPRAHSDSTCYILVVKKSKGNLMVTNMIRARRQWLTPAILTIQEAKIRRIVVGSQLQANGW